MSTEIVKTAWIQRNKLYADGNKLRAERNKLYAERYKLYAERDKLYAEGDIVFLSAVITEYGNLALEWKNWNEAHNSYECHLENGIIFDFKEDK